MESNVQSNVPKARPYIEILYNIVGQWIIVRE